MIPPTGCRTVFRLEEKRTVANDWVVRYDNRLFQLEPQSGRPPARSHVVICEAADGRIQIRYRVWVMRWTEVTAAVITTTPTRRRPRAVKPNEVTPPTRPTLEIPLVLPSRPPRCRILIAALVEIHIEFPDLSGSSSHNESCWHFHQNACIPFRFSSALAAPRTAWAGRLSLRTDAQAGRRCLIGLIAESFKPSNCVISSIRDTLNWASTTARSLT
jgi:hypothetical protein